jgi:shikimate 5-dehydrogenase
VRAKGLGEELRCDYLPLARAMEARAQIVCNATAVGMGRDETPYPAELWKKDCVAFDAVYTPRETRFLREARAAGAEVADGMGMFLRQANAQARHFVGRTMPTELMKELAKTL